MIRLIQFILPILLCVCGALGAEPLPRTEAASLWRQAYESQQAQLRAIRSVEGKYTVAHREPLRNEQRRYEVTFALDDGLLIPGTPFNGKSYQRVTYHRTVGDQTKVMSREDASAGGEIFSRSSPHIIHVAERDPQRLQLATWPHSAAGYDNHARLPGGSADAGRMELQKVERLENGRIRFRFGGKERWAMFECDPEQSYMFTWVQSGTYESGGQDRVVQTISGIEYLPVRGSKTLFFPVACVRQIGDSSRLELTVDRDSLVINGDIPRSTFVLTPAETDMVVRQGNGLPIRKPLRPPTDADIPELFRNDTSVVNPDAAPLPLHLPGSETTSAAAAAAAAQVPFDEGWPWAMWLVILLGVSLAVGGIVWRIRAG